MEWNEIKEEFCLEADDVISWLNNEYDKLRCGRVNPKIFDSIKVDAYGELTSLNQIANVQVSDARSIIIKPYDRTLIKEINTALVSSNMGVNPQVNPDNIRINFPAPTEDSRKQNVKKAKEILEQCKTKIKNIRQDCKKMYEKLEGISEDVIHGFNDELDKITKKYNLEVESIFEHKQVELLKI